MANTALCPGEGIGFYDSSDPANVVGPLGYFVPPVQGSVLPIDGQLDPNTLLGLQPRVRNGYSCRFDQLQQG